MDKSGEQLKEWAKAHLRWFGQSAFRLRTDEGELVFFDPFRVPSKEGPARLILVTHPHPDHYDRRAIQGLRGPGTTVLLPKGSAETGHAALSAGEMTEIGPLRVTAVAAYNLHPALPSAEQGVGGLRAGNGRGADLPRRGHRPHPGDGRPGA